MAVGRISDIQRLTEAGVSVVFNRAAKAPKMRYYEAIVTKRAEEKEFGKYDSVGDLTPAELIPEGDAISYDKVVQGYETQIQTLTYGKAVRATWRQLTYDLENVVKQRFGSPLVNAMIAKKEQMVADAYNDGFSTTAADGVYVFSDSHPLVNNPAKLNDNLVTGALSTDSIKAAKNRFDFIYDQAGNPFDTMATHILIHPAKQFQILELLNSQLLAWELSNTKNSLQDKAPIKILVNKYIDYNTSTDVSPWFVLDKSLADAGCMLQTKGGMRLDTEWDFETMDYKGQCREDFGVGFVSPGYGVVASAGS